MLFAEHCAGVMMRMSGVFCAPWGSGFVICTPVRMGLGLRSPGPWTAAVLSYGTLTHCDSCWFQLSVV